MDGLLDYILRACMLHDTPVALAFRRALGVDSMDAPGMPSGRHRHHASHGVYDGMAECFENRKRVRL